MKALKDAMDAVNAVLDEGEPNAVELVELQPALAETGARLSALAKSRQRAKGAKVLEDAAGWKAQFEARTHDPAEFGKFLASLVNDHGMSLREAGRLVGIPNASGVKSRIAAVSK